MKICAKTEKIQERMIKQGYDQVKLSTEADVSLAYLNRIIKGEQYPGPKVANKICKKLKSKFDDIFFITSDNKS